MKAPLRLARPRQTLLVSFPAEVLRFLAYLKNYSVYLTENEKALEAVKFKGSRAFKYLPPARIERATPGLGNLCSIQLSYGGELKIYFLLNINAMMDARRVVCAF